MRRRGGPGDPAARQQFRTASDEPVRKFAEGTRRIGLGMEGLRKGTIELGRVAVATGGAFAAGITQVAKNYEQLYYIAQRTGTTIAQIAALNATSSQAGKALGELAAGVEMLRQKISEGGAGMKNWLDSLAHVKWDEAKDKGEYYLTLLGEIAKEYNKGNEAYWSAIAREAGFTDRAPRRRPTVRWKTEPSMNRTLPGEQGAAGRSGRRSQKLGERSAKLWKRWARSAPVRADLDPGAGLVFQVPEDGGLDRRLYSWCHQVQRRTRRRRPSRPM
jgi:hypothetical protein